VFDLLATKEEEESLLLLALLLLLLSAAAGLGTGFEVDRNLVGDDGRDKDRDGAGVVVVAAAALLLLVLVLVAASDVVDEEAERGDEICFGRGKEMGNCLSVEERACVCSVARENADVVGFDSCSREDDVGDEGNDDDDDDDDDEEASPALLLPLLLPLLLLLAPIVFIDSTRQLMFSMRRARTESAIFLLKRHMSSTSSKFSKRSTS